MKKGLIFLLSIATVLVLFYFFLQKNKIDKPAFVLKLESVKHSKFVYLNVWNTKCKPCIAEMHSIDSLALLYQNKVDFVFLSDDSEGKVNRVLKSKNISIKNCSMLNDGNDLIDYLCAQKGATKSYPLHFILNEQFEIIHFHSGAITGTIFDPLLTSALKRITMN